MRKVLLILIFFCICYNAKGQETVPAAEQGEFDLSVGMGAPEMINLKLLVGGRFQAGVFGGFWPDGLFAEPERYSYGADIYFHFDRSMENSRFRYYFNVGIAKLYPEENTFPEKTIHYILYTRIGRSINFKSKCGINIDIGGMFARVSASEYFSPMYTAAYGHKVLKSQYDAFDIYPSVSISFFTKL